MRLRYLWPILWLIVIFFLSTEPGKSTHEVSFALAEWLRTGFSLPYSADAINRTIRKIAHIFVFATEGILVAYALPEKPVFPVIICSAIALVDEGHKHFVPGRHCHPDEIILDIISAVIAIIIFNLIRKFQNGRFSHSCTSGN